MASVCCRTEFIVPSLDTEHLLQKKVELSQMDVFEPELKTNLEFAISAMDTIPHMMKKNAELLVEGNKTLLTLRAGTPNLRCVVFQGPDGIKIHHIIKSNAKLCEEDLHEVFFRGHDCPHSTPCREQAMNAVYSSYNPLELNIVCKELRITFSDPNPEEAIMVPNSQIQ